MGVLDFNFDVPAGERYAPSPERVSAWQDLLPPDNFCFAPPVSDRAAWEPWQDHEYGRFLLEKAREYIATPFPAFNNDTFIDCLERQDVTQYNAATGAARQRQTHLVTAAAIWDDPEIYAVFESDFREVAKMNTWMHPGNDLKRLNFDGKTKEVDLVGSNMSRVMGQSLFILGDRLSPDFRQLVRDELQRRTFDPTRERLETGRDVYWWVDVTHNWNAVCFACITEAAAALLPAADRAWWFAASSMHVPKFRDSFTGDGFCTEGISYWSYGLSNYLALSELYRLGTGGLVDLFEEPHMSRVALFPERCEIQPGVFPTYADCILGAKPLYWMQHWQANHRSSPLDQSQPATDAPDTFNAMGLRSSADSLLWMFQTHNLREPRVTSRPKPLRNWFKEATLLVCRPAATTGRQFSATLLGGNNGVNHNHNDLGTFTVVLDGRTIITDPGVETYSMRTFGHNRYDSDLINSYGHPVPRVAGELQQPGPEWITRTLETEFTDDTDRIVLDLRRAYDAPSLRRLEREYIYDRRGDGSLTIIDRAEFAEASEFESALITYGEHELLGDGRLALDFAGAKVHAEVTLEGGELEITTSELNEPARPVPEPYETKFGDQIIPLPQPGYALRVALRAHEPVTAVTLTTVIRPV